MKSKAQIILLIGLLLCASVHNCGLDDAEIRDQLLNDDVTTCEELDWQDHADDKIDSYAFSWNDMSIQNVQAVMKTGKTPTRQWYEEHTNWGNTSHEWQTDSSNTRFILFGSHHTSVGAKSIKTVGTYWMIEVLPESAPMTNKLQGLSTYLDVGKITQFACLCRKDVATEKTRCVPAKNTYTIKEVVLGFHNGGAGTGNDFFYHGTNCVVPPVHPPPNGEDPECIWAIMAGKQFRDGSVKNVVKAGGENSAALVKCIQNIYATRTSTLKCFYTGVGAEGDIPDNYIKIPEDNNDCYQSSDLKNQGYTDQEIKRICDKVATDTPSGCLGYKDTNPKNKKTYECVCPAIFGTTSSGVFRFNDFAMAPTAKAYEDRSLNRNLSGNLNPNKGCKTKHIVAEKTGCLVADAEDYVFWGDVRGEECRACKTGWYLDYSRLNGYGAFCAAVPYNRLVEEGIAEKLKNCSSPAVKLDIEGKPTEWTCAMCDEFHTWIEGSGCTRKDYNTEGVKQCSREYGNYQVNSAEAKCYECATGSFLSANLKECFTPTFTEDSIGHQEEKYMAGCRIASDAPGETTMPAQLSHVNYRCLLCHDNYVMTGPNGIECKHLHLMDITHKEKKLATRQVRKGQAQIE